MSRDLAIAPDIVIPASELRFTFVRSAGPGGQNVNKVNSKAVLRWRVADSPGLPAAFRARFMQRHAQRINSNGELIITSDQHREQLRNRNLCLDKLVQMAHAALTSPRKRIRTRPTRAAVERRLRDKQHRARAKEGRRFRDSTD